MYRTLIGAFCLIGLIQGPQASATAFDLQLGTVSLEFPKGWTAVPKLFGVPLAVLGPMTEGSRPTLYVIPLGKTNTVLSTSKLKDMDAEYLSSQQALIEKDGGKLLEYYPYRRERWKRTLEVHSLGIRYSAAGEEKEERTHFAVCGGRLYHFKSFVTPEQKKKYSVDLKQMLDSFVCHS